jgi:hypothetical protein
MMITGLDISSTCPSAYRLSEVPFKLSSKVECTNWGAYLNQHLKTKGPVSEKEHTAFLNLWLEHFLLCGPSLAPTKNYLPFAYELDKGHTISLGKLFLGEIYRNLHLMSLSLLSQKKLRTGGPWWFIKPLLSRFHPKLPLSSKQFFFGPKWEANPMHQLRPGLVQSSWWQVKSFRFLTVV